MTDDHKADARAAFMGLIFGTIALLLILYGIVQWTNARFEGHKAAPTAQH